MNNASVAIRKAFGSWLTLPNNDLVDIVAATLLANRLPGKPIWLAVVGPPATGKTEVVQALESCLRVHMVDGISPATFASGYKESKASNKRFGLLEQMSDGKPHLVVVKDFSTVLQKRLDQRGEILGQLRCFYDGKYTWPYGNDVTVCWEGKMGMIVCSTGQYDKELRSLATFGDRFLVFRPLEGRRELIAERAARNSSNSQKMEAALRKAYGLLDQTNLPKEVKVSLEARRLIAELSDFVTRARSIVPRHPYTREIEDLPELEGTARVAVQLTQLSRGLMVYFGLSQLTDQILDTLESVTFSSIPPARAKVLTGMSLKSNVSGRSISEGLDVPSQVVRRALEDLKLLGIVESSSAAQRSAGGGWEVIKRWKPHVFRMQKWIAERTQDAAVCG